MPTIRFRMTAIVLGGMCLTAAMAPGAEPSSSLKKGTPDLKSAGPLAFGPDGVLFVGDTRGQPLFAIDTGDRDMVAAKRPVEVKDLATKVAGALGTNPQQIMINDLAVNPRSGNVYLSVARGRGPDATPLVVRVNAEGKVEEVPLVNIPFSKAELPNAPAPGHDNGMSRSPTSPSSTAVYSSRGCRTRNSPRN